MQEHNDSSPRPPSQQEMERVRRQRNMVMALLLAGFVVLVFAISIVKMG